jgi:aldehyde dehydrogenase (NAD+)
VRPDVPRLLAALGLDTGLNDGASVSSTTGRAARTPAPEQILEKRSPATGEVLARVMLAHRDDADAVAARAVRGFHRLREVPAPRRGEVVRAIGDALRDKKDALGALVSLETGKIESEGRGEVQEMVDIADYACGLSRTLGGRTLPSERPGHRLVESWHPLGPVAVITAFNFPVAVWSWNALLALVCGDSVVWKPSLKAPLSCLAVSRIVHEVLGRHGLEEACGFVIGTDDDVGQALVDDKRFPLVSATGSTRMGRAVQARVGARFGRTLLELGGNNAVTVLPDADLSLATRAILFGAVGTTGQRCTSTRRVLVHRDVAAPLTERLLRAYAQVKVGHPLDEGVLMGPLVDEAAVAHMQKSLDVIRAQGGQVLFGGRALGGCYVEPALVKSHAGMAILNDEVFAPILHLVEVASLDEAIALNNAVPQGLSSSIFTRDLKSAERFLSASGSDCGIANVNAGTSGAEIGGAFGGEKETGGGREAGSDSWKAYMRRQTTTVNFSDALPLAQGIAFDVSDA